MMVRAARTLESAAAEGFVICANTMHQPAPDIAAAVRLPIIPIADAAAAVFSGPGCSTARPGDHMEKEINLT